MGLENYKQERAPNFMGARSFKICALCMSIVGRSLLRFLPEYRAGILFWFQ